MREAPYSFGKLYNKDDIKILNKAINENLIDGEDDIEDDDQD